LTVRWWDCRLEKRQNQFSLAGEDWRKLAGPYQGGAPSIRHRLKKAGSRRRWDFGTYGLGCSGPFQGCSPNAFKYNPIRFREIPGTASLRECSGSGTMIRSRICKTKGCGERTKIGQFRKADRTVAKPAGALILRERKLLTGSGGRRHNQQSRPVEIATGLRRGCSRTLGQTSGWRRSRKAERVGRPAGK